MYIGIDLALRKIGLFAINGAQKNFEIISSDPKTVKDEDLLIHNGEKLFEFLFKYKEYKVNVVLEGLSFNSSSSDHDLISANHWQLRVLLKRFENFTVHIIPPKSWQKSIVTKEWLATFAADYPVVRAKKGMKLTKEQKAANSKSKAALRKLSKEHILGSVPKAERDAFSKYVVANKLPKDAIYDLADAYCLAKCLEK